MSDSALKNGYKTTLHRVHEIGVPVILVIQIGMFAFFWGGLQTGVQRNTQDIETLRTAIRAQQDSNYATAALVGRIDERLSSISTQLRRIETRLDKVDGKP